MHSNTMIIVFVILILVVFIIGFNRNGKPVIGPTQSITPQDPSDDTYATDDEIDQFVANINNYDPYVSSPGSPNSDDIPSKEAYQPILTRPDNRYVYFQQKQVYLLPCQYLDFSNPYHRWMYYYYPEFYYNCYPTTWPYSYPRRYHYGYYDPHHGGYYGPSYGPIFWRNYKQYPQRYRNYMRGYRPRSNRRWGRGASWRGRREHFDTNQINDAINAPTNLNNLTPSTPLSPSMSPISQLTPSTPLSPSMSPISPLTPSTPIGPTNGATPIYSDEIKIRAIKGSFVHSGPTCLLSQPMSGTLLVTKNNVAYTVIPDNKSNTNTITTEGFCDLRKNLSYDNQTNTIKPYDKDENILADAKNYGTYDPNDYELLMSY